MDRLLELTSRAERSHFWFRGFRAFVEPLIRRALHGTSRPRMLDCGCGTGVNLELLRRYGRADGFDLTMNGLEAARALGRGPVVRASVDAAPFRGAAFDLVTCFDVMQTLPDGVERDAVREMHRLLRDGGYALVNVAALEMLRGRHSALSEETRRYTPAGLRRLFESEGFEIQRISFLFASLFPLMFLVRLFQRWTSGGDDVAPGEFEISVPAAPINGLLTMMLWLEAQVFRLVDLPIGSSVVCLARKPPRG